MMDVPSQFLAARTLDSRINANLCQICSTLRLQRSPLRLHQASSPSQMAMCLPNFVRLTGLSRYNDIYHFHSLRSDQPTVTELHAIGNFGVLQRQA